MNKPDTERPPTGTRSSVAHRQTRRTSAGPVQPAAQPIAPEIVLPPAPVRTMIACLPTDLPTEALADGRDLDRHLGLPAVTAPLFWTVPKVRAWHRRMLIDLRPGARGPRWCAGGPIRLLNLDGMRHGAALAAAVRHQLWAAAVRGTRSGADWTSFHRRHLQDPDRYPFERARLDFEAQPRVLAMRAHNAASPTGPHLDPYEVDVYQAGLVAYQHLHATAAVCGDALLTDTRHTLRPDSATLADRITYLTHANALLARLRPDARLLALAL